MKQNFFINITILILSGILTGLPFHFPEFYFLSWFSLVPFFLVIKNQTPVQAFKSGLISGICFFTIISYWLIYPQLIYELPLVFACGVVVLLNILLAIFWAILALIINHLIKYYQSSILFLIPTSWVGLEYLRQFITGNLSFGLIGYTQAYFPILIQIADITGVYGVSFLIVLINVFIYKIIEHYRLKGKLKKLEVIIVIIILLSVFSYGLIQLQPSVIKKSTLKLGLIQPNIPQKKKWDSEYRANIINKYINLTNELIKNNDLDLIIWPETAIPFVLNDNNQFWQKYLFKKINNFGLPLFSGALNRINNDTYNQAILIDSNSQIINNYSKIKLVPFGEYIPFRKYLPDLINQIILDKKPGKELNNFKLKGLTWSAPICSEILNPELVRKLTHKSHFLINLSNEAWFKESNAPTQIWQSTIFRAVENNKPIIKVSNTGISGIINAQGKIQKKIPAFQVKNLEWELKVKNRKESTIYNKYGNYFVYLILLTSLLIFLFLKKLSRRNL